MRAKEWAALEGLHEQTVWKWCREGRMPVPVERVGGLWLVHDPKYEAPPVPTAGRRTVCYARVSSSDQKADLQRQADRLKAFAINLGAMDIETVLEVGSGVSDNRRKLNKVLADPTVGTIIVEHRDRLASVNAGLIEAALTAQGRRLIVVDDSELGDDLEADMTEVLTLFCARLYGRQAARRKAEAALKAMRNV